MALNRGVLPSRRFWTTYRGIALLGLAGGVVGASLGTVMLLFRGIIEPSLPLALDIAVGLASKKAAPVNYEPAAYFWIAGGVYAMAALWVGVCAWSALLKPLTDRRVDSYLARKYGFEEGDVRIRMPPRRLAD
jgi:hypothetical protein